MKKSQALIKTIVLAMLVAIGVMSYNTTITHSVSVNPYRRKEKVPFRYKIVSKQHWYYGADNRT